MLNQFARGPPPGQLVVMTTPAATQPVPPSPAPPDPPAAGTRRSRLLHPDPVIRRLAWLTLVNAFGNGLFMTVGVLFFTRALHFSAAGVGLGLTLAGLCGVLASMPGGRAADRWGTKPVLMALVIAEGAGMACYGLVHSFPVFVLLACLVTAVDRASSAVRNTLYAQALPKQARVEGRAYLRAVTNVAIGAGASLAALALQADSRQAYVTAILVDAATFAAVAVMLPSIPIPPAAGRAPAPVAAGTGRAGEPPRPRSALRDLPFLVVTVLNSVLTLQFGVIEVGMPLWLVQSTHAPRVLVAPLLIVNTVLVVLLQVRATRGTGELRAAAVAFRRGALLVAACCLVAATAHGLAATAACLVLLAAAVLQSLGEVLSQAGGWALSYALAREEAMGAYQGLFNAGSAAAMMLGPGLVTVTALDHGLAGWALLAALFAVAGAAMPFAVRWTERRHAPGV
ncbi:Major Facilitator Superfamily protein [Actinacidiphila yanglinensis]|uniref:Major Facilitator Superfamily protein n=2 Tax=Actinacidiphila yanglinensis TaxID=310779 RepID=A0A1H6B4C5_9ACTN|nr:Major Facilitator Superfamily protein [Actinacidiphila yanglinensis]